MTSAVALSTLELMEVHINTLYCHDADGRLRCVNEGGDPPAPLFYMGRTPAGNFWRFRYDLPAAMVEKLDALCRFEPVTADLASPPQNESAIRAIIHDYAPLEVHGEYRGAAFWIPEGIQPPANIVLISESNAQLVENSFPWMLPLTQNKEIQPIAAAVEDDGVVSVCFCSRRPGQATEAGVETLAAYRGKGYATAVVATWAAEVRRMGCIPLYGTSWDNFASQAVARKLGMALYGEDWSIQ